MKKLFLISLLIMQNVLALPGKFENVKSHAETVAITFDACDGQTDMRILELVKEERIPITLFLTGKWIEKNPNAVTFIKENKEYFKVENHGLNHLEAIENINGVYHLKTVKDEKGLEKEVIDNQRKIQQVFGVNADIYRTAGAVYDESSVRWIHEHSIEIGGYTIAADEGAKASKEEIIKNLSKVKNGDVILMHVNHPKSEVYEGFKDGLKVMQGKGLKFEFLKKGDEDEKTRSQN